MVAKTDQITTYLHELIQLKQWVCWRRVVRNGKDTKVPFQANGTPARTNDQSTWASFAEVKECMSEFDGIGFVFKADDGFVGIDLDHCYNEEGEREEWAQEIGNRFKNAYIERSPSGEGYHIICKGQALATGQRKWKNREGKEVGLEVYTENRYFTITGDVVRMQSAGESQAELDWLFQKYWFDSEPCEPPKEACTINGEVDLNLVNEALSCIPADTYDTWIQVGLACKSGGLSFNVWDQWSRGSGKYDQLACRTKWESFNPKRLGLGKVFFLAQQHGFRFTEKRRYFAAANSQEMETSELIDWSKAENFPEPLFFSSIETPEIEGECLPGVIGEYASAVSKATQTPPAMAVMIGLSVLATTLQGKLAVSPYGDDYKEPVNIWTITALPPASRKSAVVNALTFPLSAWERKKAIEMKPLIAEQNAKRSVNEKRIAKLKDEAAKAESDKERAGLIEEIAKLECEKAAEIYLPQLFTQDCTPERLGNLLVEQGEKMSFLSDEGGIFEVMSGLYSNGHANIDVILQSHAGQPVRVDRGGRTAHLSKPALTFGLAIQPEILHELAQGRKKKFRGVGLLARFLYCRPKPNIGMRNMRDRYSIPGHLKSRYENEINRLLELPCRNEENEPHILTLGEEALYEWKEFAQSIENRQGPGGEFEHFSDWTGKLPGAALRIAGLFHVIASHNSWNLIIRKETMIAAIRLCNLLIMHALSIFDEIGVSDELQDAKLAFSLALKLAKRQDNGSWMIRQTDLVTGSSFKNSPVKRLTDALELLRERGLISGQQRLMTNTKPAYVRYLNPSVMERKVALAGRTASLAH